MTECDNVEPWLAVWADGEMPAEQLARVETHFAVCAGCRHTAQAGKVARHLLRVHAPALREPAPQALRQRLSDARGRVVAFPAAQKSTVRRWMPLAAAAAVFLAVVGYGVFADSGRVLAAQLALDHFKCLAIAHRDHDAGPAALASSWERERGWRVTIPPSNGALDLRLVVLRRCLHGHGEMAHVLYEHAGATVSLFILPTQRKAEPFLAIMGQRTVAWSRDSRTYALVGDVPADDAARLAEYFKTHAH